MLFLPVVGWLPIHIIPGLDLPHWLGTWFGAYPTWKGIGFQLAAMVFVIGSYYVAESLRINKVNLRKRPAST